MKSLFRPLAIGVVVFAAPLCALAGFASSESFLPAIGRVSGNGGAEFFTTVWATNLTSAPVDFTFQFLKQGQVNSSPPSFSDSLAPGQTKVYENVVESKLGLANAIGAARVTATGEILVSERIFNQSPGADLGDTEGLFFAGVPKSFSISLGQSASIQGVNQGGVENFRYNFALVETGGSRTGVNVQVFDGNGTLLGQKAFILEAFEQLQPNVAEIVPGFSSTNARITATVTAGLGSALLAGAQLANVSQDSSGFEMSFRDELLGGGGAAGVTSLNGLTGAVTIAHGANTTVNVNGQTITIESVGGGAGSGLTAVAHDNTLAGSGTVGLPLGVAPAGIGNTQLGAGSVTAAKIAAGQVVTSLNNLHDAVTLSAGSNVTITPTGNSLTIAASGSGGGLSTVAHDSNLKGSGTPGDPLGVANTLTIGGVSIIGGSPAMTVHGSIVMTSDEAAIVATTNGEAGISINNHAGTGILGIGGVDGVFGANGAASGLYGGQRAGVVGDVGANDGVLGLSSSARGVAGESKTGHGIDGTTQSSLASAAGVFGLDGTGTPNRPSFQSAGVTGASAHHIGVEGLSDDGEGVFGLSESGTGAKGVSESAIGVQGGSGSIANDKAGVFGTDGTGLGLITGELSAGVRGDSAAHIGVLGNSQNFAVVGKLVGVPNIQGELGTHRESTNFGVYSFGNVKFIGTMTATGTKSFVEPHPSDPTKEIRFVCLEGPESGTYFRGHGRFAGGIAAIDVPESFRSVTDADGLTVVATAVGAPAVIWVARLGLDRIVLQASSDVEFHYVVNGVRKAYRDFEALRDNESFIPEGPEDRRFALYAPEIQKRLVATGIYNADGSVNLDTAKRLGWDRNWTAPAATAGE
jgi:hypothetical protein